MRPWERAARGARCGRRARTSTKNRARRYVSRGLEPAPPVRGAPQASASAQPLGHICPQGLQGKVRQLLSIKGKGVWQTPTAHLDFLRSNSNLDTPPSGLHRKNTCLPGAPWTLDACPERSNALAEGPCLQRALLQRSLEAGTSWPVLTLDRNGKVPCVQQNCTCDPTEASLINQGPHVPPVGAACVLTNISKACKACQFLRERERERLSFPPGNTRKLVSAGAIPPGQPRISQGWAPHTSTVIVS